jgi:glycogen operon protein
MTEEDWKTGYAKSLGIFLFGGGLNTVDQEGRPGMDDSFYILFNAHGGPLDFKLPVSKYGKTWKKVWDTADPADGNGNEYPPDGIYKADDRSIVLLTSPINPGKL